MFLVPYITYETVHGYFKLVWFYNNTWPEWYLQSWRFEVDSIYSIHPSNPMKRAWFSPIRGGAFPEPQEFKDTNNFFSSTFLIFVCLSISQVYSTKHIKYMKLPIEKYHCNLYHHQLNFITGRQSNQNINEEHIGISKIYIYKESKVLYFTPSVAPNNNNLILDFAKQKKETVMFVYHLQAYPLQSELHKKVKSTPGKIHGRARCFSKRDRKTKTKGNRKCHRWKFTRTTSTDSTCSWLFPAEFSLANTIGFESLLHRIQTASQMSVFMALTWMRVNWFYWKLTPTVNGYYFNLNFAIKHEPISMFI